jgi:putative ABC transport system permease protein
MSDLILTGLLQSLILAVVAYGVMIPFRLLNFPDLTAEGAYPLGGAIAASFLLMGYPPSIAILCGSLSAGCMGILTSLIHLRLKVNTLLAGIILSTMMYSLNLRILSKPNVSLFEAPSLLNPQNTLENCVIVGSIVIVCIVLLTLFLKTDFGLRLRAVGLNPHFSKKHGISIQRYTMLGLFLGGCLSGLGGCLMVEAQSYMDVGMGFGIVIHALAALMIGETVVGTTTMRLQLLAPLIGALLYQQIQGIALSLGLEPSDLKFFTGALVLMVIAVRRGK